MTDQDDLAAAAEPVAEPLRCPGKRSPVRATSWAPPCIYCPHWRWAADLDPQGYMRPAAVHDGDRWACPNRPLPVTATEVAVDG